MWQQKDRRRPYVGITGFMSAGEIHDLRCSTKGFNHLTSTRPLMVGILASDKTLDHLEHRRPNRYPALEDIHRITGQAWDEYDRDRFVYLIHYASQAPQLHLQMKRLMEVGGRVDGFQLNIAWPEINDLRAFRMMNGNAPRVVLQVGHRAYLQVGCSPTRLVERLKPYAEVCTDFLVDMSAGEGRALDPDEAAVILRALGAAYADSHRFGIAGGLGPDTLGLAEGVMREFPDVSIDAESGLRDINDHLDLVKARGYLERAGELCDRHYGVDDMR